MWEQNKRRGAAVDDNVVKAAERDFIQPRSVHTLGRRTRQRVFNEAFLNVVRPIRAENTHNVRHGIFAVVVLEYASYAYNRYDGNAVLFIRNGHDK